MAVALVSTGVQFPDSTIQTTAASAGGSVTATASGSIANGAATVLNSNGTVSAITTTVQSTYTKTANINVVSPQGVNIFTLGTSRANPYIQSLNLVVGLYNNASNIAFFWTGTPSSGSISWSPYTTSIGNLQGVYSVNNYNLNVTWMPNKNRLVLTFPYGQQFFYATYTVGSNGLVTQLQGLTTFGNFPGRNFGSMTTTYDPYSGYLVLITQDGLNNECYAYMADLNATTGVLSGFAFTNLGYAGPTNLSRPVAVTTNPSTGKVFLMFGTNSGTRIVVGDISGPTFVNMTSNIVDFTGVGSNVIYDIVYDSTNDVIVYFYYGTSSFFQARAASYSGSTITQGAEQILGTGGSSPLSPFLVLPGVGFYSVLANTSYTADVSVSGTTVTVTNRTITGGLTNSSNQVVADTINYQFLTWAAFSTYTSYQTYSNISSSLTSTNFLGYSDASYTNGQTATIKTVGSTKSGFSGLTAGSKYYVTPTGLNIVGVTSSYGGLALNSTTLLIKG